MEKADKVYGNRKDVTTIGKRKASENKQQTTSETSNLESVSSSYNTFSENAESRVNKRTKRLNRFSDSSRRPNMFGITDNGTRLRNGEEKSSFSSDEYENSKVSVGNQKKEVGTSGDGAKLSKERSKSPEQSLEEDKTGDESETSLQNDDADDSDESDVVELDVKVCDICGDAGREDLLAICCKCPDGAEHIYCMRVTMDKPPEGNWVCEECRLDEVNNTLNTDRRKYSPDNGPENGPSSDPAIVKVSGKRRAEELETSSSFKKQALETITESATDVDRLKVKSSHHSSSDSHFDDESTEGSHSPVRRPRSQSLKGAFFKSNSFSYPNARPKTKLVDEAVLQRQKSTKELSSHEGKEMGKSMSFRSSNLGRFGPSGSKVKMLSPNSSVHDFRSLKNKKERSLERTNSVKSSTSALAPTVDKLLVSRSENNPISSGSNSETKFLKGDSKLISGLKSTNRSSNLGAEVSVSQGPVNKHLPSSPNKVGTSSSSGINNATEQKSISLKEDNSSKSATPKESTNLADGPKEHNKHTGPSAQGSLPNNVSTTRNSKELKKGDNSLKDAIEAALLKKPGIYRKNKVSDQSDESSSVATMINETSTVDRLPQSRIAGNLTSAEVSTDWQGQMLRNPIVDHSKQSNGSNLKQSMIPSSEGKHLTTGVSNHDDAALSSLLRTKAIPDHECIWQGGFEINRSGKAAEFWDGLQAHLSMCASPRVFEAVNNLPYKIHLNGVSRISAWPSQFEKSGVKEDNIAIYFFAKDVDSYEKSYQVLLDDMIRGDLALIGSINGVELLIFPSSQLPEKSSRWNMVFFLWGVLRGKKRNSLHLVSDKPEISPIPQAVSITPYDKKSSLEDACSLGSMNKDDNVNSQSQGNFKLQTSPQENATNKNISSPPDSLINNVAPVVTDKIASVPNKSDSHEVSRNLEIEPKKRAFIDLSEDDDITTTNQINNTWRDVSGRVAEEGSVSKKQKCDLFPQNTSELKENNNGESYFFPVIGSPVKSPKVKLALDLNEDITCLAEETDDDITVTKNDEEHDVASSLSLSLAFKPPDKDDSMVLFRNM
ncbi:ASI1-immunoprecipitated protein 2-like [Rutidosis leptorrhynchoides]|uniref:ASI1-immunoprecipitated protein 2-like n=1 Tax=Rutidosis leptorrhynchoides TaxID=125765 RepID=UPI003A99385E